MNKITVLIVEDEGIVAENLASKLKNLGYEVAGIATRGEEAVAMADRLRPNLVLMDILLEGSMDGIEAAEVIHRQYDVPVIYLTAYSDPATLARAKVTGPFGYILKPFEERDLATQIELALYKHQADQQLRQQREWLRVTLTSIGDAVIATDAAAQVSFVNPVAEALTGWKTEEAVGQPLQSVFRIISEQTGHPLADPVARALQEGHAVALANHAALVTKDSRTVPIEDSAAPILDAAGQVIGAVLVFHDVTEKRRAEEEIQSLARFPAENPYPVLRIGRDAQVLYANKAAQELLEREGWRYGEAVPIMVREPVMSALSGGRHFVFEIVGRDRRILTFVCAPVADKGYANLYGRNVTETRLAEAEQARLAAIVETSTDAILSKNLDGTIQTWNATAEQMFGYRAEEIIGQPVSILLPADRPDEMTQILMRVRAGEQIENFETVRIANDGRRIDVSVSVAPLKDHEGRLSGASTIIRDITERKRAEADLAAAKASAERAKAAAEQANRAKDHFLAVLSHELRTPLTPVVMGVSILQDRTDLAPQVRETLEMVRSNVEMEARLINDLLDVTRIARGKIELKKQPVELSTVIQQAVEICKPDIEARRLHFGVDVGPGAPYWIEADVSRLQQVFWNLLKNAIKFTPHDGCVGVRCRLDNDHVLIEVNDSGIGIESDALSRVFNAFEQAERSITRQFGGLGLGLAISKALVEMHDGQIEAHSEGRDKGSTFRVRLPLTMPVVRPKSAPRAVRPLRRAPLRILLVEDHGVTAKMMQMVLTSDGHTVKSAGDVATALELAGQQSFELLMSDLGLPDGSGHDLMRELRRAGTTFPASP